MHLSMSCIAVNLHSGKLRCGKLPPVCISVRPAQADVLSYKLMPTLHSWAGPVLCYQAPTRTI
jgi:hypothetical protein